MLVGRSAAPRRLNAGGRRTQENAWLRRMHACMIMLVVDELKHITKAHQGNRNTISLHNTTPASSHLTSPHQIQYNATQHNTTQHNTTQHNTTQHNTTQHNTTQHNTTQHNTIQYSTVQYSTTSNTTTIDTVQNQQFMNRKQQHLHSTTSLNHQQYNIYSP